MQVSVTEASKLADVSRTTLYSDMNSGKLSYHTEGKNKRTIDVSELERVYGNLKIEDSEVSSSVQSEQADLTTQGGGLTELAVLREKVKLLEKHSDYQREQYEARIESLEVALNKAQDGYNSMTKLLEDQRSDSEKQNEWENAFKKLEDRVSNQASNAEEERQKILKQNRALRNALKEEQSKGFWKKLFG